MSKVKGKYTPLLLIGVLIIWGLIGYRIYQGFSASDQIDSYKPILNLAQASEEKEEVYELDLSYKDPFRIGRLRTRTNSTSGNYQNQKGAAGPGSSSGSGSKNPKSKVKVRHTVKPAKIVWPSIKYFGLVKDKGSSLYMLQLESQVIHLTQGELFQEISLKTGNQDSVLITFQGEEKYIKR